MNHGSSANKLGMQYTSQISIQPNPALGFRFDHTSGNFVTPELASLHDRQGKPLPLDELYLDTTFCSPLYKTFPTREEAQEEIWRLCKKWVTKGSPA